MQLNSETDRTGVNWERRDRFYARRWGYSSAWETPRMSNYAQ